MLLFFMGCSFLAKSPEPPKVSLKAVRIDSTSLIAARIVFSLDAFNPNASDLKVDAVNYSLELNNKPIANGAINKAVELKAKQNSEVEIPVEVELLKVFDSIAGILQKPKSEYRFFGKAQVGLLTVPFDQKGTLQW